jgi:hypothetical protein
VRQWTKLGEAGLGAGSRMMISFHCVTQLFLYHILNFAQVLGNRIFF